METRINAPYSTPTPRKKSRRGLIGGERFSSELHFLIAAQGAAPSADGRGKIVACHAIVTRLPS
jgi:hypothetical protein